MSPPKVNFDSYVPQYVTYTIKQVWSSYVVGGTGKEVVGWVLSFGIASKALWTDDVVIVEPLGTQGTQSHAYPRMIYSRITIVMIEERIWLVNDF